MNIVCLGHEKKTTEDVVRVLPLSRQESVQYTPNIQGPILFQDEDHDTNSLRSLNSVKKG